MKRVTDLDKFALEEIWRPYANLARFAERLDVDAIKAQMQRRAALTEESGATRSGSEASPAKEGQ